MIGPGGLIEMTRLKIFMRLRGMFSKKIRALRIVPPKPSKDRDGIAIVAILKNVSGDIVEWIEFHRLAGVSRFILYDNLSSDGIRDVLQPFIDIDLVCLIPWGLRAKDGDTDRVITAQVSAYAHAVSTFGSDFFRMAFIDVDEFLVPKGVSSLLEAVAKAGNPSNLSLPWHMFGHSGHDVRPQGGIVLNFLEMARLPLIQPNTICRFKCVVDPCQVNVVSVHYFETSDMGQNTAYTLGHTVTNLGRDQKFFTSENLQLNHYYCLSKSDLRQKILRGPVNHGSKYSYRQRVLRNVEQIERAVQLDFSAVDFMRQKNGEKNEI